MILAAPTPIGNIYVALRCVSSRSSLSFLRYPSFHFPSLSSDDEGVNFFSVKLPAHEDCVLLVGVLQIDLSILEYRHLETIHRDFASRGGLGGNSWCRSGKDFIDRIKGSHARATDVRGWAEYRISSTGTWLSPIINFISFEGGGERNWLKDFRKAIRKRWKYIPEMPSTYLQIKTLKTPFSCKKGTEYFVRQIQWIYIFCLSNIACLHVRRDLSDRTSVSKTNSRRKEIHRW